MLAINPKLFARAAEKASRVRPAVQHNGATYNVARSDGKTAHVRFSIRNGQLWAACDCPAGNPANRATPLPCYHVAAAVIVGANARRPAHSHACPHCGDLYACRCNMPEIDDLICDDCDGATVADYPDHHFWN